METLRQHSVPSRSWPFTFWFILLGMLVIAATTISTQPPRAKQPSGATQPSGAANEETVVATHSRGVLYVTIPYQATHSGAGRLTVEVLDPEDKVLGYAEQHIETVAGRGRG